MSSIIGRITSVCAAMALSLPVAVATAPAAVAKSPHGGSGGSGGSGGGASSPTGVDVSYPQCPGTGLPASAAFAVVGVNGGLANDYNACLGAEWAYAGALTKTTQQSVAQTYLNTGDPGNAVADWPSPSNLGAYGTAATPGYGTCGYASGTAGPGADSQACAYVYGFDMVAGGIADGANGTIEGDQPHFAAATGRSAGLAGQVVWLDVETGNSWQSGSGGLADNVADLQGMVDALHQLSTPATVGVYSTSYQWGVVTGTPTGAAAGNLAGLADWIPGASSASGAQGNCGLTGFTTTAHPVLTQFTASIDGDVSCIG